MKAINKKNPSKEFTKFQKDWKPFSETHSPYHDLKNNAVLNPIVQEKLAEEQGFICCYCMEELPTWKDEEGRNRVTMKIEHYKPHSLYDGNVHKSSKLCDNLKTKRDDLRIEYTNLLAACKDNPHCDDDGEGKGGKELCYIKNPALVKERDFKREFSIGYSGNGRISSSIPEVDDEINNVLNLNYEPLRKARRKVWRTISQEITKKIGADWNAEKENAIALAKKYRNRYKRRRKVDNKYYEYCEIVVFLLESRFKELKSI